MKNLKILPQSANNHEIATLEALLPIPADPQGNVIFGNWNQIKWSQLTALADKLVLMLCDVLKLARNKFSQHLYERIQNIDAIAGVSIRVEESLSPEQLNLLKNSSEVFVQRLLKKGESRTEDYIEAQQLPKEILEKVYACAEKALENLGGKKIISSMILRCAGKEIQISGRHAETPNIHKPKQPYSIVARIEGYLRPDRTCKIQHYGSNKLETISFDIKLFLEELRQKSCDDRYYNLTLTETMDAKGKTMVVLAKIGEFGAQDDPLILA